MKCEGKGVGILRWMEGKSMVICWRYTEVSKMPPECGVICWQ